MSKGEERESLATTKILWFIWDSDKNCYCGLPFESSSLIIIMFHILQLKKKVCPLSQVIT
jgi:hypothetical protein